MHLLTKQQILSVQGRRYAEIEVPELGGKIRLASLSAGSSLEYKKLDRRRAAGEDCEREQMVLLLSSSCVDAAGAKIFDKESAEAFLDVMTIEMMHLIAAEIVKLSTPPEKKPKADEPAEAGAPGNSGASPSAS
jgi:hypothetical protein